MSFIGAWGCWFELVGSFSPSRLHPFDDSRLPNACQTSWQAWDDCIYRELDKCRHLYLDEHMYIYIYTHVFSIYMLCI